MSLEHSPGRAGDAPTGRSKGEEGKQALPTVDRIIGESECCQISNLSRTSRWRMMRRQEFPAKVRISPNRTGWRLSQVLEWLHDREAVV